MVWRVEAFTWMTAADQRHIQAKHRRPDHDADRQSQSKCLRSLLSFISSREKRRGTSNSLQRAVVAAAISCGEECFLLMLWINNGTKRHQIANAAAPGRNQVVQQHTTPPRAVRLGERAHWYLPPYWRCLNAAISAIFSLGPFCVMSSYLEATEFFMNKSSFCLALNPFPSKVYQSTWKNRVPKPSFCF